MNDHSFIISFCLERIQERLLQEGGLCEKEQTEIYANYRCGGNRYR